MIFRKKNMRKDVRKNITYDSQKKIIRKEKTRALELFAHENCLGLHFSLLDLLKTSVAHGNHLRTRIVWACTFLDLKKKRDVLRTGFCVCTRIVLAQNYLNLKKQWTVRAREPLTPRIVLVSIFLAHSSSFTYLINWFAILTAWPVHYASVLAPFTHL